MVSDCLHDNWLVKPVYGSNNYLVAANGRVFSKTRLVPSVMSSTGLRLKKGSWIKDVPGNQKGYRAIGIKDRLNSKLYVHRLVAEAFIANPDNKLFVNHKDNDITHNCLGNLEWCTVLENIHHMIRSGNQPVGEKHKLAKLKNSDIATINEELSRGVMHKDIAKRYGVSRQTIGLIKNKITWTKI